MIALFLDAPLVAQIAFVVGGLCLLFLAGLLVWAYLPLNPDHLCDCQTECCGDEPRVPPVYGDDR